MIISSQNQPLSYLSMVCAAILFLAVLNLPIEYYKFLRIAISVGGIIIAISSLMNSLKVLIFLLIVYIFNPIFPLYLQDKTLWIPIDILCGLIFLLHVISFKSKSKKLITRSKIKTKDFNRDKIY